MKRLSVLFLTVLMVCAFSGCGTSSTDDQGTAETSSETATTDYNLGDYEVSFGDSAIGKDYDGAKCILIAYDFSNYSEDTTGAYTATYTQAFQDGVELEHAYPMEFPEGDWQERSDNYMKDIRPDNTISVCEAFILTSDSPVEVEISELVSLNELKVTKTYQITE